VVFSGGSKAGSVSEAEAMAALARTVGIPRGSIVLEQQARNTWENVAFSLPAVESCESVAFCSDPVHAARARRYARLQRPDLGERLVGADDYRFLERWWIKLPAPCTT
jgi:uncharacterized SAM-binding protein YcdF (DUF218 family)